MKNVSSNRNEDIFMQRHYKKRMSLLVLLLYKTSSSALVSLLHKVKQAAYISAIYRITSQWLEHKTDAQTDKSNLKQSSK